MGIPSCTPNSFVHGFSLPSLPLPSPSPPPPPSLSTQPRLRHSTPVPHPSPIMPTLLQQEHAVPAHPRAWRAYFPRFQVLLFAECVVRRNVCGEAPAGRGRRGRRRRRDGFGPARRHPADLRAVVLRLHLHHRVRLPRRLWLRQPSLQLTG